MWFFCRGFRSKNAGYSDLEHHSASESIAASILDFRFGSLYTQ
jgi:hypothetical protein